MLHGVCTAESTSQRPYYSIFLSFEWVREIYLIIAQGGEIGDWTLGGAYG
jgi:hypothetical protein